MNESSWQLTTRGGSQRRRVDPPISDKENVDLRFSRDGFRFFDLFNAEWFSSQLPAPLVTFKPTGRGTLGHFRPGRNEIGAKLEVNINTAHLNRPLLLIITTVLHEMIHLAQYASPDLHGRDSYRSNYHNAKFREKAAALGVPSSGWGVTTGVGDTFKTFCIKNGIEDINYRLESVDSESKFGRRRQSKLRKWQCSCEPSYGIWVAVSKFSARCNVCERDFHLFGGSEASV